MTRRRRLAGFVRCLFDDHALALDLRCNWLECGRKWCQERRLTEGELAALERTGRVRPRRP